MSNINIFVAGAKELKQERTCIKALANELSSKYQSRGLHIIAQSYEHFKDDQQVYNAFIVNEADIAIFIIDEGIGPKTQDEFFKATDSLSRDNHPEVIVFMRKHDQDTPSIKEAKDIVSARLGDKYYVEYKDLEELKQKAKERLDKFALEKSYTIGRRKLGVFRTLFFIALFLLVIVGGMFWIIKTQQNRQSVAVTPSSSVAPENKADTSLIVFAGGGSVRNFIKDKTGKRTNNDTINIDNYPNSINIPLPSGSAWHILTEEAEQYKRYHQHKYFSVCLSSGKMDRPSAFNKPSNESKKAKIIEIQIGIDENTVYISKRLFEKCKKEFGLKDNEITCEQLVSLLNKINHGEIKETTIYSTTQPSGTLKSYSDAIKADLGDSIATIIHEYSVFYDHTPIDIITGTFNDKDYLLLGSQYYTINDLKDSPECKGLVLKGKNGVVSKPIFIYFLAFTSDVYNGRTEYYIGEAGKKGEPITSFLMKLGLEPSIGTKENEKQAWNRLITTGKLFGSDIDSFNTTIKKELSNKKQSKH